MIDNAAEFAYAIVNNLEGAVGSDDFTTVMEAHMYVGLYHLIAEGVVGSDNFTTVMEAPHMIVALTNPHPLTTHNT